MQIPLRTGSRCSMMTCNQEASNLPRPVKVEPGHCRTANERYGEEFQLKRKASWTGMAATQTLVAFVVSFSQSLSMATITKKELIDRIAEQECCKRIFVKRVIQSFLDVIVDELGHGNRLEFRDFGVFETKIRASRQAQNPKTMDKVHVPSKRTVKFKIGRIMKERMLSTPPVQDEATGLPVEPSAPQKRAVGVRGNTVGTRKRV